MTSIYQIIQSFYLQTGETQFAIMNIYSVPLLELSKDCGYCKTGHFALKKDVWKGKVEYFLEEFLCRHTGAREKVKEVKKIEADEAEKQKKEKSVDACRGSDNNIHCVRLESENCLIVALKNTPFEKLVGPLLCNSSSLFISDLP